MYIKKIYHPCILEEEKKDMWLSLFMSHQIESITRITNMLSEHDILTKVICRSEHPAFYEVFVPQPEFGDAQNFMLDDELFN